MKLRKEVPIDKPEATWEEGAYSVGGWKCPKNSIPVAAWSACATTDPRGCKPECIWANTPTANNLPFIVPD